MDASFEETAFLHGQDLVARAIVDPTGRNASMSDLALPDRVLEESDQCYDPTEVRRSPAHGLLALDDAIRIALDHTDVLSGGAEVSLRNAIGCYLHRDLIAQHDLPRFDQSAMDGYALSGIGQNGIYALARAEGIRAGGVPCDLAPGYAVGIATGARIPAGADRVVMQERTRLEHGRVRLTTEVRVGANIRVRGEDARRGIPLLPAGTRLNARSIALLAAQGSSRIEVRRSPRMTIVSSGDELRQPGDELARGSVFDSNRPMLLALAAQEGADVVDGGCFRDDAETLRVGLLKLAADSDFIVMSGSSSVGEYDIARAALLRAGARVRTLSIAIKPGKPALVGQLGKASVLIVPGNPFAAFVSWFLLGRSMLHAMLGIAAPDLQGRALPARNGLRRRSGRTEFAPARLVQGDCEAVELLGPGGSARLAPLSTADGLVRIEAERGDVREGETVRFIPFSG